MIFLSLIKVYLLFQIILIKEVFSFIQPMFTIHAEVAFNVIVTDSPESELRVPFTLLSNLKQRTLTD